MHSFACSNMVYLRLQSEPCMLGPLSRSNMLQRHRFHIVVCLPVGFVLCGMSDASRALIVTPSSAIGMVSHGRGVHAWEPHMLVVLCACMSNTRYKMTSMR